MDCQTFKNAVEGTKQQRPHLLDEKYIVEFGRWDTPVSDGNIRMLEQALEAKLSDDSIRVLQEYGGGDLGYQPIYPAQQEGHWYLLKNQPPTTLGEFVTNSKNGCGDYYGFRVMNGLCDPTVMFCDYEQGFEVTA